MPTKIYEKGHEKKGGRKKGSPDIRREFKNMLEFCQERGVDARQTVVELLDSNNESIRIQAAKLILERTDPHLKQIEHKGEVQHAHDVIFLKEKMSGLVKENKKDV